MNITCPSCESTYQLADGSLGATGRKVRCTRCGTVWHAMPADGDTLEPEPDTEAIEAAAARFREPSEDEWKAALAEDGAAAATAETADLTGGNVVPFRPREGEAEGDPPPPAAAAEEARPEPTLDVDPPGFEPEKRKPKTAKPARKPLRKPAAPRKLPIKAIVFGAAAVFVAFVIAGAFVGRDQVVRLFPDFASLYELAGLKVNLRGLDFSGVETRREMDGSTPVLVVEGMIENVTAAERPVPMIRFALISSTEREVYAWTMEPPKPSLAAGESMRFKSRLSTPPDSAVDAVVRFTDRRGP